MKKTTYQIDGATVIVSPPNDDGIISVKINGKNKEHDCLVRDVIIKASKLALNGKPDPFELVNYDHLTYIRYQKTGSFSYHTRENYFGSSPTGETRKNTHVFKDVCNSLQTDQSLFSKLKKEVQKEAAKAAEQEAGLIEKDKNLEEKRAKGWRSALAPKVSSIVDNLMEKDVISRNQKKPLKDAVLDALVELEMTSSSRPWAEDIGKKGIKRGGANTRSPGR